MSEQFTNMPMTIHGRHVSARYREASTREYRGNPLIEALPPMWTHDQVTRLLSRYPDDPDDERRNWPTEWRLHLIYSALDLFVPLPMHRRLESQISLAIRQGYRNRNPLHLNFWNDINRDVDYMDIETLTTRYIPGTRTLGFSLVGISGIGKTSTLENILSTYPQLVYHSEYNGCDFAFTQLVWMKINCPHDGSVRGLCLSFMDAADDILGTNYYRNYARNGRATKDEMIVHMARIAAVHGLGILVLDELQHLSAARSGGVDLMLNYFVTLQNNIGIPIVSVGTPKALPLLRGEFRQARRSSSQGSVIWDRMENNAVWKYLISTLWRYQYVKKPSELTKEIYDVLYDETQGITDLAVKLMMLAQIRAITTGIEHVTPRIIHAVARDNLSLVQPVLKALRGKDDLALIDIADVYIDWEEAVSHEMHRSNGTSERTMPTKQHESNENEDTTTTAEKKMGKRKPKGAPDKNTPEAELVRFVSEYEELGEMHDALVEVGYIRSANEFL